MSADAHVTHHRLKALSDRKARPAFSRRQVLEHLAQCPACARKYASWLKDGHVGGLDRALRVVALPALHGEVDSSSPRDASPQEVEASFSQLAALPAEECDGWIERHHDPIRGLMLAERLIQESDRNLPANAGEAARFADLAYRIAIRSGRLGLTVAVRATARKANAKRIAGKHDFAASLLNFARQLAEGSEPVSALASVELDRFEGALRLDENRFAEAEALFVRARQLYERLEDPRRVAHMDLNLSNVYHRSGQISRAVSAGRALYEGLSREADPVLFLCAENNLALFLCDAGEFDEALLLLESDDGFCTRYGDRYTKSRRLWVAGRASAALGDDEGAEEMLRVVRNVLLSEDTGYDAALVSLDLALVYAKTGRVREVRETAEALAPIFRSYRLHREAAAALWLFLEAAREETATAGFVAEVGAYLRQARYDSKRTFRHKHDVN